MVPELAEDLSADADLDSALDAPSPAAPGAAASASDLGDMGDLDGLPRAQRKVELDLDDAPFLAEDEPELEIPAAPAAESPPAAEEAALPAAPRERFPRKLILAVAAGLLLIVGGGLTLKLTLFSGPAVPKEAPAPAAEKHAPAKEEPKPAPVAEAPPVERIIELQPFWVEKLDAEGKVRFVHLQFALASAVPRLEKELALKTTMVRDAVYFLLTSKDYAYLADNRNVEALKADLAAVLNQLLGSDRLSTVYLQAYLVK